MKLKYIFIAFFALIILQNCLSIPSSLANPLNKRGKSLEPVGGWLLNSTQMISSYKSSEIYRLSLEAIIRRDVNGIPVVKQLDKIDFSLKGTDYISRGSNYCTQKKKDPNLVVLLNPQGIHKAWTIRSLKFKEISIKGIQCNLDED